MLVMVMVLLLVFVVMVILLASQRYPRTGVSWRSALAPRGLAAPADLYLEGKMNVVSTIVIVIVRVMVMLISISRVSHHHHHHHHHNYYHYLCTSRLCPI